MTNNNSTHNHNHNHNHTHTHHSDPLSTSDLEAGFIEFPKYPFPSSSSSSSTTRSRRPPPSMAEGPHFFSSHSGPHHFLDSCHLCHKPLGSGRDIFMYRGDTPFCSEECRGEQIEMDEAEERRRAELSKKYQQKQKAAKNSTTSSDKMQLRAAGARWLRVEDPLTINH